MRSIPGGEDQRYQASVAGRAQILVVPDLEAGNMLAKNLTFLAKADAAGIVLGARVPIILTSRADSVRSRVASCAVAVLHAHAHARRGAAALPAAQPPMDTILVVNAGSSSVKFQDETDGTSVLKGLDQSTSIFSFLRTAPMCQTRRSAMG